MTQDELEKSHVLKEYVESITFDYFEKAKLVLSEDEESNGHSSASPFLFYDENTRGYLFINAQDEVTFDEINHLMLKNPYSLCISPEQFNDIFSQAKKHSEAEAIKIMKKMITDDLFYRYRKAYHQKREIALVKKISIQNKLDIDFNNLYSIRMPKIFDSIN
ncbi:hypothetical protein [Bacillus sp. FSL M8-0168]|uniref:hypothetical protein n=1 Tax=Bacillus sp. FSL M8-0168 TaxID=2921614 RepID=UPI0030FDA0AE